MDKKLLAVGATVVVLLLALGAWWQWGAEAPVEPYLFPIAEEDSIGSWDTPSVYRGEESEQKVRDDIMRLEGLLGQEDDAFTDYEIYVSIANQYGLLGDGRMEYEYLGRALALDRESTGIALYNMGRLMERLGALHTARAALERAVEVQGTIQYRRSLIDFLTLHYPGDPMIAEQEEELRGIPGEFSQ